MTPLCCGAAIAACLIGCMMLHAETITIEQNTFDGFEAATRDRFIAVDREPLGIRLARSYLITNETGVTGKCFDAFGADGFAKIRFDVPLPDFERGLLLIYQSYTHKDEHPKTVAVNGRQRPYVHDEPRMLTGGWARHDVAAEELRAGANEVIIGGGGGLHVDTFSHAGKSARSFDGGRTWKPDALGPDGEWSGEYIVRLRMYGHPPVGRVTSPVIDPATWPVDPKIRPKVSVKRLALETRQETPTGTQIDYAVRSGPTPTVVARTWTNWQPIRSGQSVAVPGHRYVQWCATLRTDSSKRTPAIRTVRLELQADVQRPDLGGLKVETYDVPQIVRSSYPFTWESDTPRVRHLRETYKLREVIRGAGDDVAQQIVLRKWVSRQWKNGWETGKYDYVPPWDALELLELASQDLSLGMCTHYSCTYVQCCAAVGFCARSVIIDHHCVAEVWSDGLGKWMIQDTGPGPGPEGYPVSFAYRAGDGKTWMNALEMHRAHAKKQPATAVPYNDVKGPYVLDDKWMHLFVRFGIPLRNNHLSQPAPAEIEHGREQYRWDRYLWWSDSVDDPTYPEYSYLSNRVADFYYTLNRVAVDLQRADADTLVVNLDTQTPNLARYEAAIDDGPWKTVQPGFNWTLHAGTNTLRVRTVNAFGVAGRESVIGVMNRNADR